MCAVTKNGRQPDTTAGQTLVLGMGNTLLRDEGVGVHTVRYLQHRHGDTVGAEFLDAGTLSFALVSRIEEGRNLIILDAVHMQEPPGTVRVFEGEDMDRFLKQRRRLSMHEVSLVDLLAIARLTGLLPPRRALVGIEPESFDLGEQPTEPVARAIPLAAEAVLGLIRRWQA